MDFSLPQTSPQPLGPAPAGRRRWVARTAEQGLAAARVPVGLGGHGRDAQATGVLATRLGQDESDPAAALAVAASCLLVTESLWRLGDRRLLPRLLSGEAVGALDLTEIDGAAHPAGVSARRTGNGWELDGSKPLVVNAGIADHLLLTAEQDDGSRSAFVIDPRAQGVELGGVEGPGGPWVAAVHLRGVKIAQDALLGSPGGAPTELVPVLTALDRALLSAIWLGSLQALTQETRDLARSAASRFGRPVGRSQAARLALADLICQVDLFGGLVQRSIWQLDADPQALRTDGAATRLYLSLHIDQMLAAAGEVAGPRPGERLTRLLAAAPLLRAASGPYATRPVLAAAMTGLGAPIGTETSQENR